MKETYCLECKWIDQEPAKPLARVGPCPHLLKRARGDDGAVIKRQCKPCGDQPIDVFVCDHPGTANEVTLKDCTLCPYSPRSVSTIERIYVINLRKRPERLASFRDLQRRSGWQLAEPIVFEAIDGDAVGVPLHFRQGGGAWGCLRSHCSILERCIMDGVGSVLVLEDDAEWFPDAWDRLTSFLDQAPKDWCQLMLGGQHMQTPDQVSPGVLRCRNTQRTHAYVIRGAAMRSLCRAWYGSTVHIDWVMGGDWQRGWPVYAPDPFIFGQAGGKSDISGRLNNSLYWNSPMNEPVIALDAPTAVAAELRSRGLHMGFRRNDQGVDVGLQTIVDAGARTEDLQAFLTTLSWEVASMRGRVTTVWCPGLDLDLVTRVHSGPVRIVKGTTAAECLRQCRGLGLKRNYCTSHVLLLRASRETVQGLAGYHRGFWLDEATGQDRGLQEAVAGDVVKGLQRWAKHTFEEAERMQAVPLVWHPEITLEQCREAFADRIVIEIAADSHKQVQRGFRKNLRPQDRSGRVRKTPADPIVTSKGA